MRHMQESLAKELNIQFMVGTSAVIRHHTKSEHSYEKFQTLKKDYVRKTVFSTRKDEIAK